MLLVDTSASRLPLTPRSAHAAARRDPPQAPVGIGEVLGGKYRVERVLGFGGMGFVVAATHLALERLVALKIMRPELCDDDAAQTRFMREARVAARLSGDHVVRVLDVGSIAAADLECGETVDVPCIVMEYLEGEDLGAHMASRRRLPVQEASELVLQACEALDEAHAASLVHRDLKPANLFLTTRADGSRCLKVLDFGITKDTRAELRLTKASDTIGSPLYVAPEQLISAHDVDARADLWALGVILYEMVSGISPFFGRNATAICASVLQAKYRPLGEVCEGLPEGFEAVVDRCLERDPDHRYGGAAELAAELARFAGERQRRSVWWTRPAATPRPSRPRVPEPAPSPAARRRAIDVRARPKSTEGARKSRLGWVGWLRWVPLAAVVGAAAALPMSPRAVAWLGVHLAPPADLETARRAAPLFEDSASLLNPEMVPPVTLAPAAPVSLAPAAPVSAAASSPALASPPPSPPSPPAASVVTLDDLPDLAAPRDAPPRAVRALRPARPAAAPRRMSGRL